MRIDDIIPYEKNARHNEKAIPVVAESIRTFGFKGAIVLRSREDPTIVNGHTRVAACKSLGWTEFPDEYIVYADNLSDEEVRALRLADNRTGEVATWNRTLLQHEMRGIKQLDMSRFNFDFKSKQRRFGAERLRTDRAYNLDIVSIDACEGGEMPMLRAVDAKPADMMGFNYAKGADAASKASCACHFFIDDYQFERCWNDPQKSLETLRGFSCVLTPDFSLYLDMPYPMQRWNVYRSRALGWWWARRGLAVVPTLSWSDEGSYAFCFEGIEPGGTVAVSTVGVKNDKDALAFWRSGMERAMEETTPTRVLLYGGEIDFDFGDAEVVAYGNKTSERMNDGR